MRLLVLASSNVVHARRWCDWFVSRGHELVLATLEPSEKPQPYDRRLQNLPLPGFLRYPMARRSLKALLREFRPELVNAHYLPGYGFLAALAARARPLALSVWGSDILLNPQRSPLHRARARFVLTRCDLVTCDSPVLTDGLRALGVDPAKIVEEPMGVDPSLFHAAGRTEGEGPPRIISTRHHEPLYDLGTLLSALELMQRDGAEFSAVLAGEGSQSAMLRERCSRAGLAGRVGFPGRMDAGELAGLLRASEIYASTSLSDSTSVSLLEAMASGAFPVASDIPGNRDWVVHERNGLLFPPGNSVGLASCLRRAMQDKQLRSAAAEINAGIIRERAVWDDNMQRVEQAFLGLSGHLR